jgi:hypothetical protein
MHPRTTAGGASSRKAGIRASSLALQLGNIGRFAFIKVSCPEVFASLRLYFKQYFG